MTEEQLINKAKKGNREAFNELISPLLGYCRAVIFKRFTLSEEDFSDAQQLACIKAWRGIKKFQGKSLFKTWLARIFINETFSLVRSLQSRNSKFCSLQDDALFLDKIFSQESFLEEKISEDRRVDYKRLINFIHTRLDKNSSRILKLVFDKEKSNIQIAKELKIPVGTVLSRLFYARQRAGRLIEKYHEEFGLTRREVLLF